MTELPAASQRVVDAAAALGLDIDIHRFPEGTRTAADAAAAVGCPLGAIAKSIVLSADGSPVLVLTSGANRVDEHKVAATVGAAAVGKADATAARHATGFAIGGTAPFGHPQPVPMLFDADLLGFDVVWAAGGTPDTVFPITPEDLLRTTGAVVADIRADRTA